MEIKLLTLICAIIAGFTVPRLMAMYPTNPVVEKCNEESTINMACEWDYSKFCTYLCNNDTLCPFDCFPVKEFLCFAFSYEFEDEDAEVTLAMIDNEPIPCQDNTVCDDNDEYERKCIKLSNGHGGTINKDGYCCQQKRMPEENMEN